MHLVELRDSSIQCGLGIQFKYEFKYGPSENNWDKKYERAF